MNKIIEECLEVLKRGGTILYPTDTVWGIGCDATNAEAVDKVYALKKRTEQKALICLVSDERMLDRYVESVPDAAYDIMEFSNKPTTIIYDNPLRVAENLVAEDHSLGIRVVNDDFCQKLIRRMRRPLVSTSANISGEATPISFEQISPEILKGVDYVVPLQLSKNGANPSAIIKLGNDGTVKILRK